MIAGRCIDRSLRKDSVLLGQEWGNGLQGHPETKPQALRGQTLLALVLLSPETLNLAAWLQFPDIPKAGGPVGQHRVRHGSQ